MAGTNGVAPSRAAPNDTQLAPRSLWGALLGPPCIVLYGQKGAGKSTETVAAFPDGLFFVPYETALQPAIGVLGYTPRTILARNFMEVMAQLAEMHKAGYKPSAVIIDDFSVTAANTERALAQNNKGWDLVQLVRDWAFYVRDACRYTLGIPTVFSAHEGAAKQVKGRIIRAGPHLPGQLPEDFCGPADIAARLVYDAGRKSHPAVYRVNYDPNWILGDRTRSLIDGGPANLAECFRCNGIPLPRGTGLEWQEEVVAMMASELLGGRPERDVTNMAWRYIQEKGYTQNERHLEWALRDGIDRAYILRARGARLTNTFGLDPNWKPGQAAGATPQSVQPSVQGPFAGPGQAPGVATAPSPTSSASSPISPASPGPQAQPQPSGPPNFIGSPGSAAGRGPNT